MARIQFHVTEGVLRVVLECPHPFSSFFPPVWIETRPSSPQHSLQLHPPGWLPEIFTPWSGFTIPLFQCVSPTAHPPSPGDFFFFFNLFLAFPNNSQIWIKFPSVEQFQAVGLCSASVAATGDLQKPGDDIPRMNYSGTLEIQERLWKSTLSL